MSLNLSKILFQIFCYGSIVLKLILSIKVSLHLVNIMAMVMVLYFYHSMILFFILMRIRNEYMMVTYLRIRKVLDLEHMDVRRWIISWPRDGHFIWDMVCSVICFTDLVVSFLGYALKIAIYIFELDTSKICY